MLSDRKTCDLSQKNKIKSSALPDTINTPELTAAKIRGKKKDGIKWFCILSPKRLKIEIKQGAEAEGRGRKENQKHQNMMVYLQAKGHKTG